MSQATQERSAGQPTTSPPLGLPHLFAWTLCCAMVFGLANLISGNLAGQLSWQDLTKSATFGLVAGSLLFVFCLRIWWSIRGTEITPQPGHVLMVATVASFLSMVVFTFTVQVTGLLGIPDWIRWPIVFWPWNEGLMISAYTWGIWKLKAHPVWQLTLWPQLLGVCGLLLLELGLNLDLAGWDYAVGYATITSLSAAASTLAFISAIIWDYHGVRAARGWFHNICLLLVAIGFVLVLVERY